MTLVRPRRRDLIAAGAGIAGIGLAGPRVWAQPRAAGPGVVRVNFHTPQGDILVELSGDKAPISVANVLRYVDSRRYDGAQFYRAMKASWDPTIGLVQGGVRDSAKLFPPVAHEPTTKTGLHHKSGALSLARRQQGTARSDFFICVGDADAYDANPTAEGDNAGFAVFGHVVDGMDVARKLLAWPTSATEGGAEMAHQMLKPPVPILTARRVAMPPPAAPPASAAPASPPAGPAKPSGAP
jgi:peptidyl-prolyl cis-trans isomerase A (cyclophilin A)